MGANLNLKSKLDCIFALFNKLLSAGFPSCFDLQHMTHMNFCQSQIEKHHSKLHFKITKLKPNPTGQFVWPCHDQVAVIICCMWQRQCEWKYPEFILFSTKLVWQHSVIVRTLQLLLAVWMLSTQASSLLMFVWLYRNACWMNECVWCFLYVGLKPQQCVMDLL